LELEARVRSVAGEPAAEKKALQQLERVLSIHRARGALARTPSPPKAAPIRRLRSRPTITGNMDVRRERRGDAFVLAWDGASGVAEWEVRISERPDSRRDYEVRDTLSFPPTETTLELPLGDLPMRVHVLGRRRDRSLVRRSVIAGLTRESWGERWQRRASAS
jgi:hypothetical protein